MAFDIGYKLMEEKLDLENCNWLGGQNVEKKPLGLRFESRQCNTI